MATSNFAFEVNAILGLESTHLESWMAKIGLNGPMTNRVKFKNHFWGPIIATNHFALEVRAILGLKSTHLESRMAKIGSY